MVSVPQPMVDLMSRLRDETRISHAATENLAFSKALINQTLPVTFYVAQLTAYYPIYQALEGLCAGAGHPTVRQVWHSDLCKTPLLQADLNWFKRVHALPKMPDGEPVVSQMIGFLRQIAVERPVALLGVLYVFEGSTLGGAMLLPCLQAAYGLQIEGVHYYRAYGADTGNHWREFKQRMNGAVTSAAEQDEVISAANQTFKYIQLLLQHLWDAGQALNCHASPVS